ncbi:hypothetical protein GQ53DRAFT_814130 [Thozetella sp. PMI_491]|nr:hypothetical protein GQ53DRAFT_814130 [Thozetella sp. PMI_491]
MSHISVNTCKQLILDSVNLYPKTTLVLDALDEYEMDSRRQLIKNKISPSLRGEIVTTLLDHSGGMFQWAYLQIKQLFDLQTELAIRHRLGKLPSDLKGVYDEIYGKIEARNKHDTVLADRALMWVMCACKPLKSIELITAIHLDPDKDALPSDAVDKDLILELCNNLLVLDSQQKVLIKTYKQDSEPQDISEASHPFQIYLRHHWAFLVLPERAVSNTMDNWWDNRSIDVSQTNAQGDNLLILAAVAGYRLICESFTKQGLPVNNGASVGMPLQSGSYGSALAEAAAEGQTKIVEFLLQRGADVHMVLRMLGPKTPDQDIGSSQTRSGGRARVDNTAHTAPLGLRNSNTSLYTENIPCPCRRVNGIGHAPKTGKRHSNEAQTGEAVHDACYVNNREVNWLTKEGCLGVYVCLGFLNEPL